MFDVIALSGITLVAAIVNGALGYGFSSITVPLALLFLTSRVLNPALVLVEVVLNAHVLWFNRRSVMHIVSIAWPVILGLLPGIAVGTVLLSRLDASVLKLITFMSLLPLILAQAAGYRRPLHPSTVGRGLFGSGIGLLYAVTTISGPPLAVALNNQGLVKGEFRAALGLIRVSEALITSVAYGVAGLYTWESVSLVPGILPMILIGVPVGGWLIQHVEAEAFRRVCMSFDAWIVGFGISTLLRTLGIIAGPAAFSVMAAVVVVDAWLLYRFFTAAPPKVESDAA